MRPRHCRFALKKKQKKHFLQCFGGFFFILNQKHRCKLLDIFFLHSFVASPSMQIRLKKKKTNKKYSVLGLFLSKKPLPVGGFFFLHLKKGVVLGTKNISALGFGTFCFKISIVFFGYFQPIFNFFLVPKIVAKCWTFSRPPAGVAGGRRMSNCWTFLVHENTS